MTHDLETEYEREANRLLYLHVNGGGGNPDLHKRLAALLRTELEAGLSAAARLKCDHTRIYTPFCPRCGAAVPTSVGEDLQVFLTQMYLDWGKKYWDLKNKSGKPEAVQKAHDECARMALYSEWVQQMRGGPEDLY